MSKENSALIQKMNTESTDVINTSQYDNNKVRGARKIRGHLQRLIESTSDEKIKLEAIKLWIQLNNSKQTTKDVAVAEKQSAWRE